MGHMDFIRSIFVRFFFQNYLEHFTDHKPSLSGRYFILVGSLISVKGECTGHDTW